MREPESLVKAFNEDGDDIEIVSEVSASVAEAFHLPKRNWNLLIDCYNQSHKKKFEYTALQCRKVLEYVKQGIPADAIFQAMGTTKQKYTFLITRFNELEDRWAQLASKASLNDEEFDEVNEIMRHPLRILLSDIDRARGIADLSDWERFNQMAEKATDMQAMKMKAKFKEFFSDRPTENTGFSVNINLGGDFISEM